MVLSSNASCLACSSLRGQTEKHVCGYAGSAWESSAAKTIFQQEKCLTYMLAREGAYLVAVWFGRALLACRYYLLRN